MATLPDSSPQSNRWSKLISIILALAAFGGGLWLGAVWLNHDRARLPFQGPPTPERLFDEAWLRTREEFLDPQLNGQLSQWGYWKDHYAGKLHTLADSRVAIATMLASLNDDYTRLLEPHDMDEQTMQMAAHMSGIGVQVVQRDSLLTVVAVNPDGPAHTAGLLPEDIITHVNDEPVRGLEVDEAVARIRGQAGTNVKLSLLRNSKPLHRTIQRADISLQSVYVEPVKVPLADKTIGYIRLSTFISEQMLPELDKALTDLADKKALIIDVRGNFGGLLTNATAVSDRFLTAGNIVRIESITNGQPKEDIYTASHQSDDITVPLVLLVDGGSASASEILAGALKDNHRAMLIGDTTFGKGLVQKVITLADGSGINLSVSRYLTPNGTDIHKKGIQPDKPLKVNWEKTAYESDPQLKAAVAYLQHQLAQSH